MAAPMGRALTSAQRLLQCVSSFRHLPYYDQHKKTRNFSTNSDNANDEKKKQFVECAPRVFSGIQPTGVPHIGNYVGAIKNWVALQQKCSSVILCIVDLHSITVPLDPQQLRQNIFNMAACLIACGIDPEKCILFQQSQVPEHAELAWMLGCLCTLPKLQHLPQWKEKSAKYKDPGLGLFTYPVLQAADILLYKATDVPVGEDQIHHIELTRHLAKSFNRNYSLIFPSPKALIGEVPKIRSLRNPAVKMSKSEPNPLSRIELTDTPDAIVEKIKKAVTDLTSEVTYDPETRPGVSNLIDIHAAFSGLFAEDICEEAFLKALDTGMYKRKVSEVVIEGLRPISDTIRRLQADRGHLEKVLRSGQERARAIAAETMSEVRQAMGLGVASYCTVQQSETPISKRHTAS